MLAGKSKHHAAGHQQLEPRRGREQLRQQGSGGLEVLDVVDQEQQGALPQHRVQPGREGPLGDVPHPERLGDDGRDNVRIGHRGERHEGDQVEAIAGQVGGNLEPKPRFADPARSGQRHEPNVVAPEEVGDRGDLARASQEGRERCRQACSRALQSGEEDERIGLCDDPLDGQWRGHRRPLSRIR